MSGHREELFRSDNLLVRQVGGFGSERLVVTFLPFNEAGRRESEGFGERFFATRGVDAIHVIPVDNSWYQYPELPAAAALVKRIAAGYRRVITYGSSMGAYAAIRFGGLVGAADALALSPQFSIDPRVAPFEARWPGEAASIDYVLERRFPPPFVKRAFIVYDPHSSDHAHVELYRPSTPLVELPVINAGHLATWILSDLGLLERLVFGVLAGQIDAAGFIREMRRRRRESSWYLLGLSERVRDPQTRLALTRRACDMVPPEPTHLLMQAIALVELGRLPQALAVFNRAHALIPGSPQMRAYGTYLLELAGDIAAAASVLRQLIADQPILATPHGAKADELATRAAAAQAWRTRLQRRLAAAVPLKPCRGRRLRRPTLGNVAPRPAKPADGTAWPAVLPDMAFDVVLIGDDLVRGWDERFWYPLRVLNLGCDGDAIGHLLWRLDRLRRPIAARIAIVAAGSADLRHGMAAEVIVGGLRAIAQRLRDKAPSAWRIVLELPPGAAAAADAAAGRESERARVNAALHRETLFATSSTAAFGQWLAGSDDDAAAAAVAAEHFGEASQPRVQGYRILTQALLEALDGVLPASDIEDDAANVDGHDAITAPAALAG
ncbi:MAG: hypothetical protein ACM3JG_15850 [Thiohalocapsa sp.]